MNWNNEIIVDLVIIAMDAPIVVGYLIVLSLRLVDWFTGCMLFFVLMIFIFGLDMCVGFALSDWLDWRDSKMKQRNHVKEG